MREEVGKQEAGGGCEGRMVVAVGVCLALHCAALFSNSFIVAGRAVSVVCLYVRGKEWC